MIQENPLGPGIADYSELTPAPWGWQQEDKSLLTLGKLHSDGTIELLHSVLSISRCKACQKRDARCFCPNQTDAAFITLARNAFDVMQRRSWYVIPYQRLSRTWWIVQTAEGKDLPAEFADVGFQGAFADPFTALVEADRWMTRREALGLESACSQ